MFDAHQEPDQQSSGKGPLQPGAGAQAADSPPGAPWYLVYTKPRQEQLALTNLRQQAFAAYLPLFKVMPKAARGESFAAAPAFEPMFARYVFFQPGNARQSIGAARSTLGVNSIVSFGSVPATVRPEVLAAVRMCEDERNQLGLDVISPFQPGRRVRLRGEGLQGLQGLVHSVSAKRVTLLLEILGQQKLVGVKHHQIELV